MKCMNCGKHEANIFYRENINGTVNETAVCEKCAEKIGLRTHMPEFSGFGGFDSGFDRFFDSFPSFGLMRGGRNVFDDMFEMMNSFEKSFFAPAKTALPSGSDAAAVKERKTAEAPSKKAEPKTQNESPAPKNELQSLRKELKKAISEENFEQAAVLRDKIRAFDKKSA